MILEWCHWHRSGVFIVNFELILHTFCSVSMFEFAHVNVSCDYFLEYQLLLVFAALLPLPNVM